MDLGAALLLGAGLLGLFGFLGYHAWQVHGAARSMAAQADARGWAYSRGKAPMVYTLTGDIDGSPFTVECRRATGQLGQNRGSAPTVTALTVAAPPIEGLVVAEPAMSTLPGADLANALLGGLFRKLLLGEYAGSRSRLMDFTPSFKGEFPATHTALATRAALASWILNKDVIEALADLIPRFGSRRPVVLIRGPGEVSVRVMDAVESLDEIEALAKLAWKATRS